MVGRREHVALGGAIVLEVDAGRLRDVLEPDLQRRRRLALAARPARARAGRVLAAVSFQGGCLGRQASALDQGHLGLRVGRVEPDQLLIRNPAPRRARPASRRGRRAVRDLEPRSAAADEAGRGPDQADLAWTRSGSTRVEVRLRPPRACPGGRGPGPAGRAPPGLVRVDLDRTSSRQGDGLVHPALRLADRPLDEPPPGEVGGAGRFGAEGTASATPSGSPVATRHSASGEPADRVVVDRRRGRLEEGARLRRPAAPEQPSAPSPGVPTGRRASVSGTVRVVRSGRGRRPRSPRRRRSWRAGAGRGSGR